MQTVSRFSVGLLSMAKNLGDGDRNTFTLGIDYKLEDDKAEIKSPDEGIDKFNEIQDLPTDTLNPAVEALTSSPLKDAGSRNANKKYC